jgi:hypothetical protein
MSDTPRTDAQAAYCEARARRNGRIAWRLRSELADARKSLGAVADEALRLMGDLAAMRESIESQRKVFREDGESLEDRLNKAVCDLADMKQASISLADHREAMRMAAVGYVRELAEARRQVAVLVSMAMFAPCSSCAAKDFCDNQPAATPCEETIAAWAAQQAKEGVK